jgi:hypothetical protein
MKMKKLFVIAAAAGLSFAATASTVTWGAQDADTIDSSKIATGTFYLMYASTAFDSSKFTGETFTADTLKTAGLDKTVDTFEYSSTSYKKKNNAITPTSAGISGNGLTLYEVLISSDGKNLAWGTTTANIVAAAGLNQTKTLNSFTMVAASNVPEPTSGLLLLVGGAMLALRRKRK